MRHRTGCLHLCAGQRTDQLYSERIDRHGRRLTTVPVTMPNVQTAGNLNVVIIGWNDTTTTVSSVVDTEGNTYAIAAPLVTGTGLSQTIFFAKNIVGEASNPNEVTVTFSEAAVAPDVRVLEYKGLDIASPVDVTAGAVGTSNLADSGVCTTTTQRRNSSWLELRWPAACPRRARASQL